MLALYGALCFAIAPVLGALAEREVPTFELRVNRNVVTGVCEHARIRTAQRHRLLDKPHAPEAVTTRKHASTEDGSTAVELISVFAHDEDLLRRELGLLCSTGSNFLNAGVSGAQTTFSMSSNKEAEVPTFDVRLISGAGPSDNRVDLTFFSDGYVLKEKKRFYDDVRFLVEAIAGNQTFYTVAPLLNFWAAYTPSKESGVGSHGKPLDTPFGLYRPGTELRSLLWSKPDVSRAACDSLGTKCDYPVFVGNDRLYGGMNGEFVTITPSLVNGPLVLRHELGHNLIDTGEEYDGGDPIDYWGVNSAPTIKQPLPWEHWLTSPPAEGSRPRVERVVMPLQDYAWTMLNTTSAWSTTFVSAGSYARHLVRSSLSGLPHSGALSVLIDGEDVGWEAKEDLGLDRWHYDIYRDVALSGGPHEIAFKLNDASLEGHAQLCSVEILEYGFPDEFNASADFYGAFPTFDGSNKTHLRPTNEDCLMRITNEPEFCSVCIEGLWMSLLSRVDPIDSTNASCAFDETTGKWTRTLALELVDLTKSGSYALEWQKDGITVPAWADKSTVEMAGDEEGSFEVFVRFLTEEIRLDPNGYTRSNATVVVDSPCP
ncbi:hypothetical protein PENSPDRAFT_651554 [Peniophora sp. CONT]|nr:hypothetical protein PENSPDRAFT_651554 [Peniophora sp. CONT]